MRFWILFLLMIAFCTSACQPFTNDVERIALECGVPKPKQEIYVKLLSSQGAEFTANDSLALKSVFRNEGNPSWNLAVTDRGCLSLPRQSGLLQVVDARNGESLSVQLDSAESDQAFFRFRLTEKAELEASLSCQQEGLFASTSFAQPMLINFSGDPSGLELKLDLYASDQSFIKTLYQKSMGESELRLPPRILVESLSEGAYQLKLSGHHVSEGLNSKPRLLNAGQSCALNVLRGELRLGELSKGQRVFAPGENLPWQTQSGFESLFVCVEPRQKGVGELVSTQDCRPKGPCQDPKSFKARSVLKAEQSGLFDYYVYSENRAGDRSQMSCETLIVSERAPTLQIAWKHEELNKPGAILKKPYAILQASIEVNHELLNNKEIEDNLLCKVDFEIKGRNSLAEESVRCTEGSCRGKSLASYTPCSKDLSFTLVEALNQAPILSSRLRLSVKASDGVGHSVEAETSVWINKSIWVSEDLAYQYKGVTYSASRFLIDASGDVLTNFGSRVAVYRNEQWVDLDTDQTSSSLTYRISRGRDSKIYVARISYREKGIKVDVLRYDEGTLSLVVEAKEDNLLDRCDNFMFDPQEVPYCIAYSVHQIYRIQEGVWTPIPSPVGPESPLYETFFEWKILADGSIAGLSLRNLLIWDGARWDLREIKIPDDQSSYNLYEDYRGRLWLYAARAYSPESRKLYRIEGTELVEYPAPLPLTQFLNAIYSPPSAPGLKKFDAGLQSFNFATDRWEFAAYPQDQSSLLPDVQSQMTDSEQTYGYMEGRGFFEMKAELLYWPIHNLGRKMVFFNQDIQRFGDAVYFLDDARVSEKSLVRLKTNFIAAFDSQMIDLEDKYAVGSRIGSQKQLEIFLSDRVQVTVSPRTLQVSQSPKALEGSLVVSSLDEDSFCYSTLYMLGLYNRRDQSNVTLARVGTDKAQFCIMTSRKEVWWLDSSTNSLSLYDGKTTRELKTFQLNPDEKLDLLRRFDSGSTVLVMSNQRVFIFAEDGSILKVLNLSDFPSTPSPMAFQGATYLDAQNLLISVKVQEQEYLTYLYQSDKDTLALASDYMAIVGKVALPQAKSNGEASYLLAGTNYKTVVEWKQGVWRKVAGQSDFDPLLKVKTSGPAWFAPDQYGHLWLVTLRPNILLRLDLEHD